MSVYHEAPTEVTTPLDADDATTHTVCPCQVDAAPRLALCGLDCSDGPECLTPARTPCVVCWEMIPLALFRGGCQRCTDGY